MISTLPLRTISLGDGSNTGQSMDSDDDGLVDAVESQYGTDLSTTIPMEMVWKMAGKLKTD